jgi:hypothetical protein
MGQYEEDERQYIVVDVESKKVYDMRKENDLMKI